VVVFCLFIMAVLYGIYGIGRMLWDLGIFIHDAWVTESFGPRDYLFVVFVGRFPMQLLAFAFRFWIKTRKRAAVVVFSLIASGLLLTAYVASILYCVWPRITVDPLDTSIPVIFFLLWAWPLWWAFIASARRLRLLTRAPRGSGAATT